MKNLSNIQNEHDLVTKEYCDANHKGESTPLKVENGTFNLGDDATTFTHGYGFVIDTRPIRYIAETNTLDFTLLASNFNVIWTIIKEFIYNLKHYDLLHTITTISRNKVKVKFVNDKRGRTGKGGIVFVDTFVERINLSFDINQTIETISGNPTLQRAIGIQTLDTYRDFSNLRIIGGEGTVTLYDMNTLDINITKQTAPSVMILGLYD